MNIISLLESNAPFNYSSAKDNSLEAYSILHKTHPLTGDLLHLMVHSDGRSYTLARTSDTGFNIRDLEYLADYNTYSEGLVECIEDCTVEYALSNFIKYLVSKGL